MNGFHFQSSVFKRDDMRCNEKKINGRWMRSPKCFKIDTEETSMITLTDEYEMIKDGYVSTDGTVNASIHAMGGSSDRKFLYTDLPCSAEIREGKY